MDQENNICALCRWNTMAEDGFFCAHPRQEDLRLKHGTKYDDGCGLFEEREERKNMYDSEG